MHTSPLIAGAGVLAACSLLPPARPQQNSPPHAQAASASMPSVRTAPPPAAADALSVLERACIDEPGNALSWQRLGEALLARGDSERAARMMKQARSLQQHALVEDYAVTAGMPRTELRALGPALLELRRVDAGGEAIAAQAGPAAARLEISNGNGVNGLAAAWARALQGNALTVVQLSNVPRFAERSTRIEYRAATEQPARHLAEQLGLPAVEGALAERPGSPDLRLVLGRDQIKKGRSLGVKRPQNS